jgi:hypothetical protein
VGDLRLQGGATGFHRQSRLNFVGFTISLSVVGLAFLVLGEALVGLALLTVGLFLVALLLLIVWPWNTILTQAERMGSQAYSPAVDGWVATGFRSLSSARFDRLLSCCPLPPPARTIETRSCTPAEAPSIVHC